MSNAAIQWTTTWDRSSLLTYKNLGPNPINFVSPGTTGSADIVVDDSSTFQSIWGVGGSLSKSHYVRCAAEAEQYFRSGLVGSSAQ